ncbi:MAG: DUF790 family protein [Caldisphaera sp.]|jgi:predicted nuclease of restriction endonuclease-like RecB superfamily|nr:MAG: hypothetical protein C0202_00055 [Caldisphaera sp.]
MLSSDLLRIKYRKGKAEILFIDDRYVGIINDLISLLSLNKTIGEFKEESSYLKKIYDQKLIEALTTLILRKVKVEESSPIDPKLIRSKLFSYGPVTNNEERNKILNLVSKELGIDPIKFIYSDMEEELQIKYIPEINPLDIIKEYNMELLQTAAFKAIKLKVYAKNNWKDLIYNIKKFGLMYNANADPFSIEIFGPASLLKLTERYGRSMALLIPYILESNNWKLEGEIMGKYNRTYFLEIDQNDAIFPSMSNMKNISFDSSLEESFYMKFKSIAKEWNIIREPEPLLAGNSVFIPDFLVMRDNIKIYIEIVGFWTKEYLRKKAEKIRQINKPILLVVDESLGYENFNDNYIIKFKKEINVGLIYSWLNNYYNSNTSININEIREKLSLNENVISFDEISKKYNVPMNIIKKELSVNGYTKMKNFFIKNDYLQQLKNNDYSNKKLTELTKVYGDWIQELVEFLGYQLKWIGVTDAIVKKP